MAKSKHILTKEEIAFLDEKAAEINSFCESHGIFLVGDRNGIHAFKSPNGFSIVNFMFARGKQIKTTELTDVPIEIDYTDDLEQDILVEEA